MSELPESPPRLSFSKSEAIGFGWNTAKSNLGFFILFSLLYLAVFIVLGIIGYFLEKNPYPSVMVNIITWILSIVLSMGFIKISLKLVDGNKPTYSDLFSSYTLFFNYLFGYILYSLIMLIGFILLFIPGIYFALKFQFCLYFIADKGVGPITALKMSSQATKGVKINLLLFGLLLWLVMMAGILAFIVGLFIAFPTTMVASAFVYRKLSSQIKTS